MFFRWFVLLTFVVALSLSEVEFKDCNFTDFRFQSKYNLGQQDELNKTFQLMKGKISVPDITYPINSYTNYSLTQIKTTDLQYLDARQKAEIMGNDTIVIAGGYLQTTSEMVWKRKDFLQRGGTLQTTCKSEQIMFSKNLTTERGFLLYKVMDYYNISFQSVECKITRYEPANTSSTDLDYINQLINKRTDNKETLKLLLAEEINKRYFYYLNNSLYSERHQLDDHFTYEWKGPTKNLKIDYQVLPTGADLEKDGLSFTFVTEIKDDDKWQCGASIPHDNFDVRQYGGIQEFISLSLFKNTLRYGIEAGALDTVLNLQGWESRMFQFYAGDLYEAIPYISRTYPARQQITGNCTGSTQDLVITAEQKANEMTVKTTHNCQLFIKGTTKIVDIKVHLYSEVQAAFEQTGKVNFYIRGFTHNLSYTEQPSFKIQNYQLANALVLSCLKRLIGLKTFGSGWPTYQMDYPQLKVMSAGYVFLYDSSHIGSSQL